MKHNHAEPANHRSRWTLRELKYVEAHYGHQRTEDIALYLKRSTTAVCMAAVSLGVTRKGPERWSAEEDRILQTHYPAGVPVDTLMAMLSGRTRRTIQFRAGKLGLMRPDRWTQEECDILRQYYPLMGSRTTEKLPGREAYALRLKARALGIAFQGTGSGTEWTEDEIRRLKHYCRLPLDELAALFPGRTKGAVKRKRENMRRNPAAHGTR